MQVGRKRRAAWLATGVALALTAAACGGDDGGDDAGGAAETATAETISAEVQSGVKDALASTSTSGAATATTAVPAKAPETIEEWEALWAKERAAVVKKIKDNKWGISADGKTVTGPEGFTIDLTKCATGWSDTEGLTDTEIKIGFPTALSGLAADTGLVWKSADVIFKHYGEKGAFKDSNGKTRKVNFIVKDSEYIAAKTIPLVDELLDSEKAFAIWTFGTPDTLKVYDKINERCVPNPFVIGGSPAWGDPVNHPWTTGSYLSYLTEAVIWKSFIDEKIDELSADDGKVTVGAIVANSEFGLTYENAFKQLLAASPNKDKIDLQIERFEITAPTVTDPMTTLASKNPEIFLTMTGGVQCTQILNEAANNGMKDATKYKFMSSVCKSSGFVGKEKVGGDGSQSNGWYIVGSGYTDNIGAPSQENNGFAKWARQLFTDNGVDHTKSGSYTLGLWQAYLWAQTLQIAGELPGGLTRTNFILAQRAFEGTSPVHLEGIKINMNGNKDSYFLEGSDISIYDSAAQVWKVETLFDLSGKSPNCPWDPTNYVCKS